MASESSPTSRPIQHRSRQQTIAATHPELRRSFDLLFKKRFGSDPPFRAMGNLRIACLYSVYSDTDGTSCLSLLTPRRDSESSKYL